jgi:glycosyltransferase involved in cell wall biosynthesis
VNLLIVISHINAGGSQTQVKYTAEALAARGHNVSIAYFDASPYATVDLATCDTFYFQRRRRISMALLRDLVALVREKRIDIVYSLLFPSNLYAAIVGYLTRTPVVTSERNIYNYSRTQKVIGRLYGRLSYAVVANCEAVRQATCRSFALSDTKVRRIYNTVGTEIKRARQSRFASFAKASLEGPIIAIAANFVPSKNYFGMLEGIAAAVRAGAKCTFLIAGEGPLRDEIIRRSQELGLETHVVFLGFVSNVRDLFAFADFGLLFSDREGFPNVILEAFVAGCPVIATDVGGVREVITTGYNGWLVTPRDPEAFGRVLSQWVTTRPDVSMRDNCYKTATRFEAQQIIAEFETLFKETLRDHDARSAARATQPA